VSVFIYTAHGFMYVCIDIRNPTLDSITSSRQAHAAVRDGRDRRGAGLQERLHRRQLHQGIAWGGVTWMWRERLMFTRGSRR
jgi:hypothetical protein